MRIHLISPTHYLADGSLHKTTRYWTSGITLPYLKALTPPGHQVNFTEELMQDLDLARVEREVDVIGLTAMGPQIKRAYDLADHFRSPEALRDFPGVEGVQREIASARRRVTR